MAVERRSLLYTQLERQTARARLIQRSMVAFYTALAVFVATSVLSAVAPDYAWVAIVLGLAGAISCSTAACC